MLHFGEEDKAIPMDKVRTVAETFPSVEIHTYAGAGHGFNCTERDDYDPDAAKLALDRTLAFLQKHLT
ncbi:dienelactone hydrolase family protein, partial [Planococcus sp. SIMBA_160]